MNNAWLAIEDAEEDEEESGVFMGVFNRPPAEIARSLPRPITPSFEKSPNFNFHPNKLQQPITSDNYLESPTFRNRTTGFICGRSLVSVF